MKLVLCFKELNVLSTLWSKVLHSPGTQDSVLVLKNRAFVYNIPCMRVDQNVKVEDESVHIQNDRSIYVAFSIYCLMMKILMN